MGRINSALKAFATDVFIACHIFTSQITNHKCVAPLLHASQWKDDHLLLFIFY
jgi:hypothetical protein